MTKFFPGVFSLPPGIGALVYERRVRRGASSGLRVPLLVPLATYEVS